MHNQIVVQDGRRHPARRTSTTSGRTDGGTNSFAASGCAAEWPAASIQSTLNTVQVVLRCADSNGSVVRLDLATLTIKLG
jgi:hypothetical protein